MKLTKLRSLSTEEREEREERKKRKGKKENEESKEKKRDQQDYNEHGFFHVGEHDWYSFLTGYISSLSELGPNEFLSLQRVGYIPTTRHGFTHLLLPPST